MLLSNLNIILVVFWFLIGAIIAQFFCHHENKLLVPIKFAIVTLIWPYFLFVKKWDHE